MVYLQYDMDFPDSVCIHEAVLYILKLSFQGDEQCGSLAIPTIVVFQFYLKRSSTFPLHLLSYLPTYRLPWAPQMTVHLMEVLESCSWIAIQPATKISRKQKCERV